MFAAGVAFPVGMVVMAAVDVGVKGQPSPQKVLHCPVGAAGDPAEHGDPRLSRSVFCPAADAAADQAVHALLRQQARQGPVAAAVGVHHLAGGDGAAVHLIELELAGVPEVLEHLAVFIGDCDDQRDTPPI